VITRVVACLVFAGAVWAQPASAQLPLVKLTPVATFDQPLAMAYRTGDPNLYIAEKTGRVKRLGTDETILDLSGRITSDGERGLLGLAFSPDGGFLYVDYTDLSGDTHVTEYAFVAGRADTTTARDVVFVDQPFANHNGGNLAFGPDGYLYVALGDGGGGGDPLGNGQRLDTLLGKLLRIDPRGPVPADNPFVSTPGARPEIWAYGLRNPWRFSFDRLTGDLWTADVGQNLWEEVDVQSVSSNGGENYGWNRMEGNHPYDGGTPPPNHTPPVYEYSHATGGCSVTGGYVYRGARIPSLAGAYVFGDYCLSRVVALRSVVGINVALDTGVAVDPYSLASFGEDQSGELYVLSLAGGVFRIDPAL
jgi:glucose/arabinose dehydrogenase